MALRTSFQRFRRVGARRAVHGHAASRSRFCRSSMPAPIHCWSTCRTAITESIINSLSQLAGLRVVPRSLAFRYKGLQADPATVGLALNARTILTGRVTQHGDVLNIQAELVDTRTESQLWGQQFRQNITRLPDGAGGDRLADLRGLAAEAHRRAEEKAEKAPRPSTPTPIRNIFAADTTGTTGRRTASTCARPFRARRRPRPELRAGICGPGRRVRRDGLLRFRRAGLRLPALGCRGASAISLDPDIADPHVTLGYRTTCSGSMGLGGAPSASCRPRSA